ncbi:hypothetical protein IKF84_01055, partial [Candidatus Saccharibacteria bacterium]|nr:hypothetical protein [Candidatus Saccharibacteria bacterium]
PKGWTLPSKSQMNSIGGDWPSGNATYVSNFSPVLGGNYANGIFFNEFTHGRWWGSTVSNDLARYNLDYDGSFLTTLNYGRRDGLYIRCIQAS